MGRTGWILLTAALSLTGSGRHRTSLISWNAEITHCAEVGKSQGAEASLSCLLGLPPTLRNGQTPSADSSYKRYRAIASHERFLGRWTDADQHLRECVTESQSAGKVGLAAKCSLARFTILIELQQFDEAARTLEAARSMAADASDSDDEPYLLFDRGFLLEKTGHFEEAISPIQSALKMFLDRGMKAETARARVDLAWAFWEMGRYDEASDYYKSFQLEADSRDQHLGEGYLGNLAYRQRNYAGAVEYYRHAAEMAKTSDRNYYATWLTNEATGWIELGDLGKATARNRLALSAGGQLPNMSERPHAELNQARIAEGEGETGSATRQLKAIIRAGQNPGVTLEAYSELARIYQASGDAVSARQAYQGGLQLANHQRSGISDPENQLSFAASVMNLNQQYVAGLMEHGREEEAFETAEASRANMLRESLNLSSVSESGPRVPDYRSAAQRTGTAYFAYWLAPDRSYLWVITGTAFQCYPLPGERELRDRIDRFQKLVQERGDANEEGAALFQTLVAPARKQLGSIATVVIVPDGALYSTNFETLREGSAGAPYWMQDVTISIAPSLSLLLGKSGTQPVNKRILLLGDATEWSTDFPALLQSSGELDQIAAKFPQAERTRLTKAQATPAEYERQDLASYRYIHFATHAVANRSTPLQSAIILSQANGRGTLTAHDVLAKQVSAELISISACRSAGSRTYAGEGLVGLAWAFLHSGAHSVVAGLWDVSDYSSPLIMGGMYGGLAQGIGAPEALRAAKLELLKPGSKYADPYYWGPFLLYRGAGAN